MTIAQPTQRRTPVAAIGLAVAGGVLMIIGSLYWLIQGMIWNGVAPAVLYSAVVTGILFSVVVFYAAYRLYTTRTEQMTWGAVIMLFSVFCLVITGGGFGFGTLLGLIGGIWAIVHGE